MIKWCCCFLWSVLLYTGIQAQTGYDNVETARRQYARDEGTDNRVKTCFFIADHFMDMDQYDSAQVWLNKIGDIYTIKHPTLFNYYLLSRQAEVYYYNGLLQLGLQAARRSLDVATALNDSLLLADAYNMTGLFYMTMNQGEQAKPYFYQGIPFARQPPYPPQYLSLAKPHHLYGNLAETFEKLNQDDSAQYCNQLSLRKATDIRWLRGMAVANTNLGKVYLKQSKPDSSYKHYAEARQLANTGGDIDVELVSYGGLALAEQQLGHKREAEHWLESGFSLIRKSPQVNALFTREFLGMALRVYKQEGDTPGTERTYVAMVTLDSTRTSNNTRQIQNILNISAKNENRLLKLEVAEANQKKELAGTRLYLALLALLLLLGIFLIYRYYTGQKLKVAALKNNISQDLHDDVGASLSSLHIYSALAQKLVVSDPVKAGEMLQQISENTQQLMENMGDIVWAMKPQTDDMHTLEARIKNYGSILLNAKNIHCHYQIDPGIEAKLKNMDARKNILLIIKEAINNMAKYSAATEAWISITAEADWLLLTIRDNGRGFDPQTVQRGNGLNNISNRCVQLSGNLKIDSAANNGTALYCRLPVATIRDTRSKTLQ